MILTTSNAGKTMWLDAHKVIAVVTRGNECLVIVMCESESEEWVIKEPAETLVPKIEYAKGQSK